MVECTICGFKKARFKCKLCSRQVCEDDYDKETGLCSVCLSTRCEICSKHLAIGYCMICGRIGCENCLLQVTTVSYVCRECLAQEKYLLKR